jgi:hypothetical protein
MAMNLATMLIGIAVSAQTSAGDVRAGAASVSITPPAAIPMAGYYSERRAQGVHDELQAKAIVVEQGGTRAGFVTLDLISAPEDLVQDARDAIEKATRLRGAAVMISATHSHTGPIFEPRRPFGGSAELVKSYREGLPAKIAEAVRQAEHRLDAATIFAARGREDSIAFNRRYHMKDGTVGWNPGKRNSLILKPAGPIDPDVPFVFFEKADGKPLAAYVNYAVHLDNIGEPLISADMPATLSRCLAEFKGSDMITLFSAGCCGDVNHIDVGWEEPQRGFGNAARMGTILAAEVLRSWPRLNPIRPGRIRIRTTTVSLPLAPLQEGDADRARAIVARIGREPPKRPQFLETVWAFKVLDVEAHKGRPYDVEVQAITLGPDVAWVSLPGEIFTELGLAIKQDSPFPQTIVVELANGSIGYIPSARAYEQGNYEVVSARCARGSGERLVEAAVRSLKALHTESQPAGGH